MGTLKITNGPATGRVVEVTEELVIGREGTDIEIDDPELSRRHAAVRPTDPGVEVEDLGSLNGTFVDGSRIDGVARLSASAIIRIGNTEIALELAPPPAPPPDLTRARPAPEVQEPDVTRARPAPEVPEPDVTRARPVQETPEFDATRARPVA
ncbi:MAG: segregation ATPase FtsK/SpoIIIE, family, partial [Solirubrobacteraceae bacterium]|nr:segregation ATPase FtsK/SpoIIIE, family [Solirubrobacteraceae bacterium]